MKAWALAEMTSVWYWPGHSLRVLQSFMKQGLSMSYTEATARGSNQSQFGVQLPGLGLKPFMSFPVNGSGTRRL